MTIDPCVQLSTTSADGARLVVCPHGGHVLGWSPAGGRERLWLSTRSRCGPGAAIRGGVPVVFPQFSDRGPLPKHGIARDRAWVLDGVGRAFDGSAEAAMTLRSDPASVAAWPAEFTLTLAVTATASTLQMDLTAHNDGREPYAFAAALHTYLRVSDLDRAVLHGLGGAEAEDQVAGGTRTLPEGPLPARGPQDLVVRNVSTTTVSLEDPGLGRLAVEAVGFPDRVVWNPGPDDVPPDVHDGGHREFVCVEPAAVTPMALPGGGSWSGRMVLRVLPT